MVTPRFLYSWFDDVDDCILNIFNISKRNLVFGITCPVAQREPTSDQTNMVQVNLKTMYDNKINDIKLLRLKGKRRILVTEAHYWWTR